MILEAAGGLPTHQLITALLAAVWACDDAGTAAAAIELRLRTAAAVDALRETGGVNADHDPAANDALLADLYRRAGRFEEAGSAAHAGTQRAASDFHLRVLELQLRLAAAGDDSVHTCDEAGVDGSDGGEGLRRSAYAPASQASPSG